MPKFTIKTFQLEDLSRLAMHDGGILSWEQGLGKTIAAFAWPIIKQARRVILVVPEGLHLQFQETARDFFATEIIMLECWEQISVLGLNRPPSKPGTQFFMTTYTALGQNGADEWPPIIEKDGTVTYNETIMRSRFANPLVQRIVNAARSQDRLNGVDYRSPFEAIKPFLQGIGEEFSTGKDGKGPKITCIMQPTLARMLRQHDCFDCAVVDEGTRLQANDSHIGTGVRALEPRYRLVLTGTPIKNRLESLFWLAWWAAGGSEAATARWPYAGTSEAREEFANQHLQHDRFLTREDEKAAQYNGRRYKIEKRTARVTNIHRLWKLLAPVIVRRRKDDCGEDIVHKVIKPIRIQPGTVQQEVYAFHLKNKPVASKSGKEVNYRTALGMQLNLLRQAALSPDTASLAEVTYDKGAFGGRRKSHTAWNPKMAAIMSVIVDRLNEGNQVIVGSPFTHFSAMLHGHLRAAGVSSVLLDGGTSAKIRGERAAMFKKKSYSVMVAGVKAMGEGHSFECCSHLITPSLSWAFDENEQFIHRVWRINSPEPVTIYPMVMANTIDEQLADLFAEKGDSAQLALDGKLFSEKIEEVDLSALMNSAVRSFNPNAPTIDENEIAGQWEDTLKLRLERAELRFREWHPPIVGYTVTRQEIVTAVHDLNETPFFPFADLPRSETAGKKPDWRKLVRKLR